jgi:hypothetical protein
MFSSGTRDYGAKLLSSLLATLSLLMKVHVAVVGCSVSVWASACAKPCFTFMKPWPSKVAAWVKPKRPARRITAIFLMVFNQQNLLLLSIQPLPFIAKSIDDLRKRAIVLVVLSLHVHHELTEINEIRFGVLGVLAYLGIQLPLLRLLLLALLFGLLVLVAEDLLLLDLRDEPESVLYFVPDAFGLLVVLLLDILMVPSELKLLLHFFQQLEKGEATQLK